METTPRLAIEDIFPEFARTNTISALAVVIASRQPELVERYGGEPLEETSQRYYVVRAERLIRKHEFPKLEMLAGAISTVAEAMDEQNVEGFVQLPELFDDMWPMLPDPERAISTPATFYRA